MILNMECLFIGDYMQSPSLENQRMEDLKGPKVAEWIQLAAQIPRNEYAELAKQFNPINFDATAIVRLAKAAGMKYLVVTAKHHDGFALYDSEVSNYNSVDATPYKTNILMLYIKLVNLRASILVYIIHKILIGLMAVTVVIMSSRHLVYL